MTQILKNLFVGMASPGVSITSWYVTVSETLTPILSLLTLCVGLVSGVMGTIYLYNQIRKVRRDLKEDR